MLGPDLSSLVTSIYVDSKTTGSYLIRLKKWPSTSQPVLTAAAMPCAAEITASASGVTTIGTTLSRIGTLIGCVSWMGAGHEHLIKAHKQASAD
jgi:hypothetical protein